MNNKILRESLIIFLLIIVIMFTLGILFYDYIPTTKEEISSVEYVTDANVEQVLDEIQTNSGIDIKSEITDSPLKSYTITASDLKSFAKDKTYDEGRADPFATVGSDLYENETDPNDPTNPGNQTGGGSVNSVGGTQNKTNTSQGYFNSTGKNK